MSIKPLDLFDEFRTQIDDLGGDRGAPGIGYWKKWQEDDTPCLHKNADLIRYITYAISEIGIRRPKLDDVNAVCSISVTSASAVYTYDEKILTIEDISLLSTGATLKKVTLDWLYYYKGSTWRTLSGAPEYYIEDAASRSLTLVPKPSSNLTLKLTVYRRYTDTVAWATLATEATPTSALTELGDEYRVALIAGMATRAYRKRDADASNAGLVGFHDAEFAHLVGPPVSLEILETRRQNANLDLEIIPKSYYRRTQRNWWSEGVNW